MGGSQSSAKGAADGEQVVKTSYYELLAVSPQATEEEIKKAYRRKALELHPDRNYGNEETATRIFAEVQAAYEVLSDPQERAWYDSHESAILRGDDASAADQAPTYQNVRITTADDLARMLRKFNSNVEFSDSPSGFFGFLRETFDQLAKEEEAAGTWENVDVPDYPTFGHKDDQYDDVVKKFYAAWSSFSTVKGFAWKDKYKLSEAPDRWYRRRMEQENKALRKEGVKEFNDAVRAFVAFVRKRDARFVPSTQSEAERQKILRDAAASQAARARAANQAKLDQEVPEWAKIQEPEELEESEEEEAEEEVIECVACDKTFKSERQYEAHEKSKKHQKAIHALAKKMRKQNAALDLDESHVSSGLATPEVHEEEQHEPADADAAVKDNETSVNGHVAEADADEGSEDDASVHPVQEDDNTSPAANAEEVSDSEDDDYASPETIRSRLESTTLDTPPSTLISEDGGDDDSQPSQPKMGKAAQKRAKKAAAAAASDEPANSHKCATCNAAFPSRTRLFQHIKDHGHGALKTVASAGKGKKGKAKR